MSALRPFTAIVAMMATGLARGLYVVSPLWRRGGFGHRPRSFPSSSFYRHVYVYRSRRFLSQDEQNAALSMENLYQEWTLEQDQLLWERRKEALPELAAMLGRGLKGVELRLDKLSDRTSPAYERLFCDGNDMDIQDDNSSNSSNKLVPAGEVLRRIQWDYTLQETDFSVEHYDRVEDTLVETAMDAPNTSVAGSEGTFVFAIPEHRIMRIKYKERVVWDRENRIDLVFGSMNGKGKTIDQVIRSYTEWKRRRDEEAQLNRERQRQVSDRIQCILGPMRFAALKDLFSSLLEKEGFQSIQKGVEEYVQACLHLFREVRRDPSSSVEPSWIPMTDMDALDTLSELTALLPNDSLKNRILNEIASQIPAKSKPQPSLNRYTLPELNENDLRETFVRGSGAGGQKINKTANRVVLVHEPTQLRVECQETRSLQQNRKIARKRLRLKVDEYLNGSRSKTSLLAEKQVLKKARAKGRSRARQRKKTASATSSSGDEGGV